MSLPELGVSSIKVKVDSGARSSSLHAHKLTAFTRNDQKWVRFEVHPKQRSKDAAVMIEAHVLEYRSVRSSSGKATLRPVIVTPVSMLGITWPIEITLASRDEMGFRMLLGREAIRGRFLIDTDVSYYGGKPLRKKEKSTSKQTSA